MKPNKPKEKAIARIKIFPSDHKKLKIMAAKNLMTMAELISILIGE